MGVKAALRTSKSEFVPSVNVLNLVITICLRASSGVKGSGMFLIFTQNKGEKVKMIVREMT